MKHHLQVTCFKYIIKPESEVDNVIKSDQVKPEILIGREPVEAKNVIGPEFVLDEECQCRQLKNLPIHSDSTCGRLSTNRGSHQVLLFAVFGSIGMTYKGFQTTTKLFCQSLLP